MIDDSSEMLASSANPNERREGQPSSRGLNSSSLTPSTADNSETSTTDNYMKGFQSPLNNKTLWRMKSSRLGTSQKMPRQWQKTIPEYLRFKPCATEGREFSFIDMIFTDRKETTIRSKL
jgi:hypothetical protein